MNFKITKNDGTPLKFLPLFGEMRSKFINQPPSKNYIVKKKIKKITILKSVLNQ